MSEWVSTSLIATRHVATHVVLLSDFGRHLQLDDLVRDEVGGVLELDGRLERDRGGELPVEEW